MFKEALTRWTNCLLTCENMNFCVICPMFFSLSRQAMEFFGAFNITLVESWIETHSYEKEKKVVVMVHLHFKLSSILEFNIKKQAFKKRRHTWNSRSFSDDVKGLIRRQTCTCSLHSKLFSLKEKIWLLSWKLVNLHKFLV